MFITNLSKIFFIFIVTINGQLLGQSVNTTEYDNPEPRIVGGVITGFKGHKHQVSIRLKVIEWYYGFGKGHVCGGSIISSTIVLTAAHCLFRIEGNRYYLRNAKEFTAVMGTLNRFNNKTKYYVQRDVVSFVYHKDFNLNTMINDIAIFYLDKPIPDDNPYVRPISLDVSGISDKTKNCTISGWGRTGTNEPPTNLLLAANVAIIDLNQCIKMYQRIGDRILNGMFCAGDVNGKVDSCQGDSGGPLTCSNYLTGIVSWGYGCGFAGYPGVYTNVSYYIDWIQQKFKYASNETATDPNKSSQTVTFNVKIFFIILINFIFINNAIYI